MSIKTLAIKVTVGIVGIGGVGAIAHQALQSNTKQKEKITNSVRLIAESYTPLTKDKANDSNWTSILESYKKVIKKKAELAFDNFNGNDPEEDGTPKAIDTLKIKCENALNSKDENLFNRAKKWCIVPKTVTEAFKGRKVLTTDTSEDSKDKSDWDEKIRSYTAKENTNTIDSLTFSSTPITDVSKENRESMKGACKKLNEKKSYEEDYEEAIEKAKTWCSV